MKIKSNIRAGSSPRCGGTTVTPPPQPWVPPSGPGPRPIPVVDDPLQ